MLALKFNFTGNDNRYIDFKIDLILITTTEEGGIQRHKCNGHMYLFRIKLVRL